MAFAEVRCMNATMCFAHVITFRLSVIYAIKIFTETVEVFLSNKETREVEKNLRIFLIK